MATYTININEKTEIGKGLVALLKKLGYIKPEKSTLTRPAIDESLADIKAGMVHTYKDTDDFFEKILH